MVSNLFKEETRHEKKYEVSKVDVLKNEALKRILSIRHVV